MDRFSNACTDYILTISHKKTKVLAQAAISPKITINKYELYVVERYTYLRSTINSKLPFGTKMDRQIGRAGTSFARLGTRVSKTPDFISRPRFECIKLVLLAHF